MYHSFFFRAFILLMPLTMVPVGGGDDAPTLSDLSKILPPGGAPLPLTKPGERGIRVELLNRVRSRLENTPAPVLDAWVIELERIMGQKLDGDLAKQACRTYFVTNMSVAFDDLQWNASAAAKLLNRAQTMPPSDAKAWKQAFETLLNQEIGQNATFNFDGEPAYAVPLVLIPVNVLHDGEGYSLERAKKYRARLNELTAEDVRLWRDKVDKFGGSRLDAAVNIILLDEFFDKEQFQHGKFKAAVSAAAGPARQAADR
jgi:hypothetical protein